MCCDHIINILDIRLFLYSHSEKNLSQTKVIGWVEEFWGRGSNGNRYMEAGTSTYMLDLNTHFVSFLKSMVIRTNGKTIQLLLSYEYG